MYDDDDPCFDRDTLADVIGPDLAADASHGQRAELEAAMHQNPHGLRQLAADIRADPKVKKPVPALVSRVRKGQHRLQQDAHDHAAASLVDRAEALYRRRYATYPDLGHDDAIEYAITHTPSADYHTELDVRQRIGHPWTTSQLPARLLPHDERLELATRIGDDADDHAPRLRVAA